MKTLNWSLQLLMKIEHWAEPLNQWDRTKERGWAWFSFMVSRLFWLHFFKVPCSIFLIQKMLKTAHMAIVIKVKRVCWFMWNCTDDRENVLRMWSVHWEVCYFWTFSCLNASQWANNSRMTGSYFDTFLPCLMFALWFTR